MNYEFEKRNVNLSAEGETIQCMLLSHKYPRINIPVYQESVWSKIWNWLVG